MQQRSVLIGSKTREKNKKYSKTFDLAVPTQRKLSDEIKKRLMFHDNKISRTLTRNNSIKRSKKKPKRSKSLGEMLDENELKYIQSYIKLMAEKIEQSRWLENELKKQKSQEIMEHKNTEESTAKKKTGATRQKKKVAKGKRVRSMGKKKKSKKKRKRKQSLAKDGFKTRDFAKSSKKPQLTKKNKKSNSSESSSKLKHSSLLDKTDSRARTENLVTFDLGSKLSNSNVKDFNFSRHLNALDILQKNDYFKSSKSKKFFSTKQQFESMKKGSWHFFNFF